MLLGLEEVEQVAASGEAETEAGNPAERAQRPARHRINRRRIVVPGSLEQILLVDEIRSARCQKVTLKSFLFVRTQQAPIPPLESWMIHRAQRREVEHTGRAAARADEPRRIWSRC